MDRIVQITDRLGKTTNFAYDNMEQLASITDSNGITTTYGYDLRGWRNSITQGGQTWQRGYDDEGVVSSRTNAPWLYYNLSDRQIRLYNRYYQSFNPDRHIHAGRNEPYHQNYRPALPRNHLWV